MRLLVFSFCCFAAQLFISMLLINGAQAGGVFFFLVMAVSAHMVIELADKTSLERDNGFMVFIIVYFIAELYLFALAVTCAIDALYPVYALLESVGKASMLCLTVLSLVSSSLTPILRNTGAAGDMAGRFINSFYSGVVPLALHKVRG